jgi:hypothetical protein
MDKHGWKGVPRRELWLKMEEEHSELVEALCGAEGSSRKTDKQVLHEAIDLANVCMMIWDNERRKL